jgi:hypothetical protein
VKFRPVSADASTNSGPAAVEWPGSSAARPTSIATAGNTIEPLFVVL